MGKVSLTTSATGATDSVVAGASGMVGLAIESLGTSITAVPEIEVADGVWLTFTSNMTAVGAQAVQVPPGAAVRLNMRAISGSATVHLRS